MQICSSQKILPLNSGSNVSSMTWFTIAKSRALQVNHAVGGGGKKWELT